MFKISELPFLQKWDNSLYIHFEKKMKLILVKGDGINNSYTQIF